MPAARRKLTAMMREALLGLAGPTIRPGDPTYEEVRQIWNGMIDRRPALFARCANAADVKAALAYARDRRLEIAIRGGGHNITGNSLADGGLVIDLSMMRRVTVDPKRRIARVEPGAQLSDIDRATQLHGLAVPTGIQSTTGIAGLTLGGGIGWLMRPYGLTCDSLRAADVVLPDGNEVRAAENASGELLWGAPRRRRQLWRRDQF